MFNAGIFLVGVAAIIFAVSDAYVAIGYLDLAREQWELVP
jgi:hypothetical protein